ncbi:hypothetical protein MHU86_18496 [Fragilaria crotonensis]|nr:hypothetical protein MHU86_18496 [Fragilaria crotonensis]
MSNLSPGHKPDPTLDKDKTAGHDDMSDTTPPTGFKPQANEQGLPSKVLKFSFVYTGNTKNKVAPSVLHTHWMQAVQEAYGDEIVIVNNKNQNVETVSTIKWTDPSIHAKQFQLHQKTFGKGERRQSTYFIIHRVLTNASLSKMRALHSVQTIMKEFKFYITDHQWNENQFDTTRIGWITSINPTYYNREQAQIKFNNLLHSKLTASHSKMKIPIFRLVFVSPTVNTQDGHMVSTKAYAIEILTEHSVQMLLVLKTLLGEQKTIFVPYSMKAKFPAAYTQAIKFQTQNMNKTRVVVLQNISVDTMFYIGPYISTINGVLDLLADSKVNENGRHTVLVEHGAFKRIRNTITQNLDVWIVAHVASDALPIEEQFFGTPRVKPIYEDGMSSGENSWLSASNASFLSMDLSLVRDHVYFDESTNIAQVFTYADITMPTHQNKTQCSATSTNEMTQDVASELTEMESCQKQELEDMAEAHRLATEKAEKLAAEQRQEIALLKAQREDDLRVAQEYREAALRIAEEREKMQEDVTRKIRNETDERIQNLQNQMTEMMENFKAVFGSQDHKRPADAIVEENNSQSDEKRQDVRSTPGKKLFPDNTDMEYPALPQQKLYDNAQKSPMKE